MHERINQAAKFVSAPHLLYVCMYVSIFHMYVCMRPLSNPPPAPLTLLTRSLFLLSPTIQSIHTHNVHQGYQVTPLARRRGQAEARLSAARSLPDQAHNRPQQCLAHRQQIPPPSFSPRVFGICTPVR